MVKSCPTTATQRVSVRVWTVTRPGSPRRSPARSRSQLAKPVRSSMGEPSVRARRSRAASIKLATPSTCFVRLVALACALITQHPRVQSRLGKSPHRTAYLRVCRVTPSQAAGGSAARVAGALGHGGGHRVGRRQRLEQTRGLCEAAGPVAGKGDGIERAADRVGLGPGLEQGQGCRAPRHQHAVDLAQGMAAAVAMRRGIGDDDAGAVCLVQTLEAGGKVHDVAHHRIVEAVGAADIAHQRLAGGDADPQPERAPGSQGGLEAGNGRVHGFGRMVAKGGRGAEHGQHPVAQILQDEPAMRLDRRSPSGRSAR